MISLNTLTSKFDYHSDGYLIWKDHQKMTGKKAGYVNGAGYVAVGIDYKMYMAHRLIFLYHHGYLPEYIDHIDGNPQNNRIDNLREATLTTNQYNKKIPSHNTSGYKCVRWDKVNEKWAVGVRKDGKYHWGGRFDDIHEAGKKAKEMIEQLHGEFARCE